MVTMVSPRNVASISVSWHKIYFKMSHLNLIYTGQFAKLCWLVLILYTKEQELHRNYSYLPFNAASIESTQQTMTQRECGEFFFFFWGTLFSRKLYLKNFNIKNKEKEFKGYTQLLIFFFPIPYYTVTYIAIHILWVAWWKRVQAFSKSDQVAGCKWHSSCAFAPWRRASECRLALSPISGDSVKNK